MLTACAQSLSLPPEDYSEESPGYNGNIHPNTKVPTEVAIFCPGGADLLAGLGLDLLGNANKLLSSGVLLALSARFLHGRTTKRRGDLTDMNLITIVGHVACGGEMFLSDEGVCAW